jgi:predicted secreted protein
MTDARIGYGTRFEVSTNNGTTYTQIAEVTNITPPSNNLDIIDVTSMGSPNRTREFIGGLNDPGEASFTMNFLPGSASDLLLNSIVDSGVAVKCRITYPNGRRWTFDGVCVEYTPDIPTAEAMTANVRFKVTGSKTQDQV